MNMRAIWEEYESDMRATWEEYEEDIRGIRVLKWAESLKEEIET